MDSNKEKNWIASVPGIFALCLAIVGVIAVVFGLVHEDGFSLFTAAFAFSVLVWVAFK